eukprot:jgi/Bigna1/135127/aug1.28_g9835
MADIRFDDSDYESNEEEEEEEDNFGAEFIAEAAGVAKQIKQKTADAASNGDAGDSGDDDEDDEDDDDEKDGKEGEGEEDGGEIDSSQINKSDRGNNTEKGVTPVGLSGLAQRIAEALTKHLQPNGTESNGDEEEDDDDEDEEEDEESNENDEDDDDDGEIWKLFGEAPEAAHTHDILPSIVDESKKMISKSSSKSSSGRFVLRNSETVGSFKNLDVSMVLGGNRGKGQRRRRRRGRGNKSENDDIGEETDKDIEGAKGVVSSSSYSSSSSLQKKQMSSSRADEWTKFRPTKMTPMVGDDSIMAIKVLKQELRVLAARAHLDPKHFFKREGKKRKLNTNVQIGRIIDDASSWYIDRSTKKEAKRSHLEAVLNDHGTRGYIKAKFLEIQASKPSLKRRRGNKRRKGRNGGGKNKNHKR